MTNKTKVVIVGAGFGGIAAAKRLVGSDIEVTLIDRRNYHLFQPMLYQVATADLSPADIAWPIRGLFSGERNIAVVLSEVTAIDRAAREVVASGRRYPYDFLILATGTGNFYFNHPEWEPHAPGLKRIIDATEIRKRILLAFERAEIAGDADEQRRLLNFVVVGGGPTGVEMVGAMAELARVALARDFRHIDPKSARIILVEGEKRLLAGGFAPELSEYTRLCLEKLGVEIHLGQRVQSVSEQGVQIGTTFIPTATVIWAAGVKAGGPGQWLGLETDHGGRVAVGPDLTVPGHPEIFVIGDVAKVVWEGERLVPGLAPAAKQGGQYAADAIRARLENRASPPFRYRHAGSLAMIGRNAAVADFGKLKLKGRPAWWFWGLVHIFFLINARAATLVMVQWAWAYLTRKKGARLITGLRPLFAKPADPNP